ncbi:MULTISPECIES: ABC transporter ATP-binding protein [Aerococcus]|uniref:ABC transporter ATP-binding protein n=2 Tax=Aerococcus TaxID=1375 RepID=A0A178HC04_9LACT|nr:MULTISPECIES: ABC transporter ATP-binding protein [Aerococcus]KAA9220403.1 ABC transporter ATP-binding protein [Aerococcus loyolae]KAA9265535.1 ABC transporter ATP-binding protein [Aerococcus loyolae]MCY3026316.1 ABC transporter ATP-binding protein [Aerococcus loyolae]MCY3027248.1 ABC transporter ATP-binding protein [Aerococcus loyolae]MCY3028870.1 ABC transporter ATP-binding protein [Aerococcus loyolae]
MNVITVEGLTKNFKNKALFHNFSLAIEQNTVHAIVGPNGSGKTSLLRILTGLYRPDQGDIQVKTDHAMLLENDYLYDDKSGLENLKLFGLYFGFEPHGYEDYAELLEIKGDLDRKVSTYSKGMKRKLSLLIIVMMQRGIIFLDEVTSGVDPISRLQIRQLIALLKDKGKTVVITSHDLDEIEKVADVVTMIKSGTLLFTKQMSDLQGESLEDLFIEEGLK